MQLKLFLIALLSGTTFSYAQTYKTLENVKIPQFANVYKTVKVKNCNDTIPSGYVVKKEFSQKNGDTSYVFTKIDTLKSETIYHVQEEKEIDMEGLAGKANITVDETNKSLLKVNYWLNPSNTIEVKKDDKQLIKIIQKELTCSGKYVSKKETTKYLEKDTTVSLFKATFDDTTKNWFKNSDLIIEVYSQEHQNRIDYYLVDKYDQDGEYYLKLKNREYISYRSSSLLFGPLVIPVKYHFGYRGNDGTWIDDDFMADANIGVFGGKSIGRYRMRYEGNNQFKELANLNATIGAFISLSANTINAKSTSNAESPLVGDATATIGVISPGLGFMGTIYNFNLGLFMGWDVGFGDNANKWNYNNRPFLGIGIGYTLTSFWKQEE